MKIKCKKSWLEGGGYILDLLDEHGFDIIFHNVEGAHVLDEDFVDNCITALTYTLNTMKKENNLEFENE